MTWQWAVIFFAALGVLSCLWAAAGWLLPGGRGGAVVCLCRGGMREEALVRRYGWLHGAGLLRVPLLAVDCGLSEPERRWLEGRAGVTVCTPEQLVRRLEWERNRIDGTGT